MQSSAGYSKIDGSNIKKKGKLTLGPTAPGTPASPLTPYERNRDNVQQSTTEYTQLIKTVQT